MNEMNVMISNGEGIRLNLAWEWVKGRIHASVYAQLGGCTAGHDMKEGHIGRSFWSFSLMQATLLSYEYRLYTTFAAIFLRYSET